MNNLPYEWQKLILKLLPRFALVQSRVNGMERFKIRRNVFSEYVCAGGDPYV